MSHTIVQHRRRQPMWFYEKNYRFLLRLFPDLADIQQGRHRLSYGQYQLELQVIEYGPYTQFLKLSHSFGDDTPLVPELRMSVRVYHDARLAEAIGYQGEERLLARYELSGEGLPQYDEKRQANLLLHDCLSMFINRFRQMGRTEAIS